MPTFNEELTVNGTLKIVGPNSTPSIETQQMLYLRRPGVGNVKNANSAALRLGSFEDNISGKTQLDINLAGFPDSTNDWGSTADVSVMTLLSNGNVGIGTNKPVAPLSIVGPNSTPSIETQQMLYLRRPGVGNVKNANSAALRLGSFEDNISGKTQLDINLAGFPDSTNDWGSTADVSVMTLLSNGNVGIGTNKPVAPLSIVGPNSTPSIETQQMLYLRRPGVGNVKNANSAALRLGSFEDNISGKTQLDINLAGFPDSTNDWGSTADVSVMTLLSNGNVGIGTKIPKEKLHVTGGNLTVEGNINVAGDVILSPGSADCSEEFDIINKDSVDQGTVMVINEDGKLGPSQKAYDRCVAGVISGAGHYKPGIILDKQPTKDNRLPIALVGKVFCKVDAQYGEVQVGDLLTTSDTAGYAMKVSDHNKALGSIIGKALRPLNNGQGIIPILIALQ